MTDYVLDDRSSNPRQEFCRHLSNREKQLLASSRLSVRPSAWNTSAPTGRIFIKCYISAFFENLSKKIKVSLKSDKNNGYFTWRPAYIYDNISLNSLFQTKVAEKVQTHFLWNNFFSENHSVYEIMWKNMVKPDRAQMTTDACALDYG